MRDWCLNGTVSDIGVAAVGAGIGAVTATVGAYAVYVKQRADSRRDEQRRRTESGLEAQQQLTRQLFECAYSAKTWLRSLPAWTSAPDTPARLGEIRKEAMTRMNQFHVLWDSSSPKLDSADVQTAMYRLDEQLSDVLGAVIQGDLSPDLSAFEHRLNALKDVANQRLEARI
jgi:hypothetical protein